MWSEISKILVKNFPYICFVLVVIGITAYLVFKVTKILTRFYKTEGDCLNINNDLRGIEGSIVGVNKSINNMQISVISLITYLKTKDEKFDTTLFKTQSPIQLTDLGNMVLSDIGGKKTIEDNLGELISNMEKQEFKSGLDVQNYASVLIMNMFNDEMFTNIKNYMFTHPVYKYTINKEELELPLDITTVNTILGIHLRDKYFEKHPELNIV